MLPVDVVGMCCKTGVNGLHKRLCRPFLLQCITAIDRADFGGFSCWNVMIPGYCG
ncbi:hypothetical protein FHW67_001186 [Herbaspirillum sp. Sphag1AN]|nr:hypothetical protein [Herbaspirillum sp. Sphag1AN]MBB3244248.1 hypothetical protein [Herbaspirillum sp. Sphag64]